MWPILVVVPPTRFTLLAALTCPASQGLFSAVLRLALLAGSVIEVIGFDCAVHLTLHLIGQGRIADPPAPARARPAMDPYFPRNTPGRTGKAQQKGREYPVRQWPLALVQQGLGEVVEGTLAAMAPVTFASGAVFERPQKARRRVCQQHLDK